MRAGFYLASFFNKKARLWIKGRVLLFPKIKKDLKHVEGRIVWMHAASLGEYEQGKPVLRKILNEHPDITPVISFFSPSGYEVIKKKNEFPHVYYLPLDSLLNVQQWMHLVRPSLVLWVKYEYWYFFLKGIQKRNIPLIMVSGIYRRNQPFFKWYGGLYREMLDAFTHFFVQNDSSRRYLSTLVDKSRISMSGDTRCDRVIEIAEGFAPIPTIEKFCRNKTIIVCGSTWEEDEEVWAHYINKNKDIRFIVAPHEIDSSHIRNVKERFTNSIAYSELRDGKEAPDEINCLVIDNIGMLSKLYHYADITYVGGGFGDSGLHNILEAAVYGKPVIFGPVFYKNFEAEEMIDTGGAITITTALELEHTVDNLLSNKDLLNKTGNAARTYIYKNAGAADKIVCYIREQKLLG
ncbi:MAG: 3-deoxy-D-manno-octulosonic acid transferase [Chitinophagaceae bacterium]|nr:3-deoxy-D-manno-octulosonic acid transferase [Chitinophagaceae bacterium]